MTASIGANTALEGGPADRPASAPHPPVRTAIEGFSRIARPGIALPALTTLCTLFYLVNLGSYPLYGKGEPREGVTVWNMLHGGGWILPMRAGVEIPSKPPLMHWLAALASLGFGTVNEWSVRMPSALLGAAGVIACYLYMRRLFDNASALLAAMVMGTAFQYVQAATSARVDMTLTFFIEVALFEFLMMAEGLTSRRMLFYLSISAAVLAKGPVGFVLPGLAALTWLAIERRLAAVFRFNVIRGAAVVAALAGSWYAAATLTGGLAFIRKQILSENVYTFFYSHKLSNGHAHPFYYVELSLLAGFLPWTPLLAGVISRFLRDPKRLNSHVRYLICWCLVVLLFYNLAHSKRAVYLLALYPALSALVALYLADLMAGTIAEPRWIRFLCTAAGVVWLAAGMVAISSLFLLWLWPSGCAAIFSLAKIEASGFTPNLRNAVLSRVELATGLALALLTAGILALKVRSTPALAAAAIAGGFSLAVLAANQFVVPAAAQTLSLKNFTSRAMALAGERSVGYLGALNYDVAFYSRRVIPVVPALDDKAPPLLFSWQAPYEELPASLRSRWKIALESGPTEIDGSGRMVLIERAD